MTKNDFAQLERWTDASVRFQPGYSDSRQLSVWYGGVVATVIHQEYSIQVRTYGTVSGAVVRNGKTTGYISGRVTGQAGVHTDRQLVKMLDQYKKTVGINGIRLNLNGLELLVRDGKSETVIRLKTRNVLLAVDEALKRLDRPGAC